MTGKYYLGLDPGLSTGYAIAYWSDLHPLEIVEQGVIKDGCDGFIDWFKSRAIPETVVAERFVIDGTMTGVWSPQIEGAIKALHSGTKVWQLRSDKATLFNQKLKGDKGQTERFEWLRDRGFEGKSHSLDAQTHLLVLAKRMKSQPTLRKYFT